MVRAQWLALRRVLTSLMVAALTCSSEVQVALFRLLQPPLEDRPMPPVAFSLLTADAWLSFAGAAWAVPGTSRATRAAVVPTKPVARVPRTRLRMRIFPFSGSEC